jgi:hypothetical protein
VSAGLCRPLFGICYQAPGRYVLDTLDPPMSIELPEGWYVNGQVEDGLVGLVRSEGRLVELASDVTGVFDDEEGVLTIEPTPEAFTVWLRSRTELSVERVAAATLAGTEATQIDILTTEDTMLYAYPASDAIYLASAGQRIRFLVALVDGSKIHIAVEAPADDFDRFWNEDVEPILESLALE